MIAGARFGLRALGKVVLLAAGSPLAVYATGCARAPEGDTKPVERVVGSRAQAISVVPADRGTYAILASQAVTLREHASVVGGHVGVLPAPTGTLLRLYAQASIDPARAFVAPAITLDAHAFGGDAFTTTLVLGANATVVGNHPYGAPPSLPAALSASPGGTALTVTWGATSTASPGAYAAGLVREGATLELAAGRYDFSSLEVKSSARILALGLVDVRVAGTPVFLEGSYVGPKAAADHASTFRLATTGLIQASGGTSRLLLIAPGGVVALAEHAQLTGAIAAASVELKSQAKVTFQDGIPADGGCACDDGNVCTQDSCATGTCVHTPVAAGTACSDGNACNGAETCSAAGTCTAGTVPVVDDGNPCTTDACNPATGVTHVAVAVGTSCSDGNACNGAETCATGGTCAPGTAPVVDDGNVCTTDACNPATGVTHVAVAVGTSCSDGNACNGAEICATGGTCAPGMAPVVDDGNVCTTDACNPATGVTHVAVAVGTSCSDGNACNGAETCATGGTCAPGTAPVVDDGNVCTTDACNPATGVTHVAVALGTSCSDGNACNGAEICATGGTCAPGMAPVVDDGNVCTTDACDPATGVTHVAVAVGTSCSDGNACNGAETCATGGTCAPGTAPTVDDGNVCTTDSCDPATGVTHVAVAVGTSCSDGNACNGAETCATGGTCALGTAPSVDDGNICTTDACDPATGITHVPVAVGTSCSDSNACNGAETCATGGTCAPGTAPTVDDGNVCTTDACDPATGVTHVPVAAGTSCSDGNACNGAETCATGGTCAPGTPLPLDDGNPCTVDTCEASGGVSHTPVAVDDGNPCTDDVCLPTGAVAHGPVLSPECCAPVADATVASSPGANGAFLTSCANPIQTGATPGIFADRERTGLLHGIVRTRDGAPLVGAIVRVLDRPELGETRSRADGRWDLRVLGGGRMTVSLVGPGTGAARYLSAQRAADVPRGGEVQLGDVRLVAVDPVVTEVTLDGTTTDWQIAGSSVVSDADGTRSTTVFLPPGISASRRAGGVSTPLPSGHLRATEYTVGPNGPLAMPGELPANSGYTFATELSLDEALGEGEEVVFTGGSAIGYVDSFLETPVGTNVPVGTYRRSLGAWTAEPNGRVIQIVSITAGRADLDVDKTAGADSGAALTALAITDGERAALASRFPVGAKLWRFTVDHFTPVDCNWGFICALVPESRCTSNPSPPTPPAPPPPPPKDECTAAGSIIGCESQRLAEELPLAGTGLTLRYASDRVRDQSAGSRMRASLWEGSIPSGVTEIGVKYEVAGQTVLRLFDPASAPVSDVYEWDGLDGLGLPAPGIVPGRVTVTHYYPVIRVEANGTIGAMFGLPGGSTVAGLPRSTRYPRIAVRDVQVAKDPALFQQSGLGIGWALTGHHVLHPQGGQVWFGDGRRETSETVSGGTRLVMGTGSQATAGLTNAEAQASSVFPTALAVARDGSLLVGDQQHGPGAGSPHRVLRVDRAGVVRIVAGGGTVAANGPMPAGQLRLITAPSSVTEGPDGSVYFSALSPGAGWGVYKVDNANIVRLVACGGGGSPQYPVDGAVALGARCGDISGVRMGPDGALYLSTYIAPPPGGSYNSGAILRIGPEGRLFRMAGGGTANVAEFGPFYGNNPAVHPMEGSDPRSFHFDIAHDLAIKPDGAVVFSTNGYVWSIGSTGTLGHLAGWPTWPPPPPPYGSAANAKRLSRVFDVRGLAADADGGVYVSSAYGARITYLAPDGSARLLSGQGEAETPQFAVDNLDPQITPAARFKLPTSLAVRDDGTLFVADAGGYRVRALAPSVQGLSNGEIAVEDPDGGLRHIFDGDGRHLRTVDARVPLSTATPSGCAGRAALPAGSPTRVRELCYQGGVLSAVVDRDGRTTSFTRSGQGDVVITSPDGQSTTLTKNAAGELATMVDAAGSTASFRYDAGLLTSYTDLAGRTHAFAYDAEGKLLHDRDARTATGAAFKTLTRTALADGHKVDVTDATGHTRSHEMRVTIENGLRVERGKVTGPDGSVALRSAAATGARTSTSPDGTVTTTGTSADPRWGANAPYASGTTVSVPGLPGGTRTVTTTMAVAAPRPANNPDGWTTETSTTTRNGKTWTEVWNKAARTRTMTSPVGRVTTTLVDERGRTLSSQVAGLEPMTMAYDAATGRMTASTWGARTQALTYGSDGYLASTTDSLSRTTSFVSDALGRVTKETRPDTADTLFSYDGTSLMTQLTPPGKPAHAMGYDSVGLLATYTPPGLALVPQPTTTYAYDAARRRTSTTLPDGRVVTLVYDAAGRLSRTELPGSEGVIVRTYDSAPVTGHVKSVAGPDAVTVQMTRAGALPLSTTWSGAVSGAVSWSYDAELRVATEAAAGVSLTMAYDNDDLVTAAGPVSLTRSAQNGLVTGVTVGGVIETIGYDQVEGPTTRRYGEPSRHTVTSGASTLYDLALDRDALGRIVRRTELINGENRVYEYGYDLAGRLSTVSVDGAVTATYTYDANGNRLTEDGTTVLGVYDAQDRIVSYGATTYAHDSNGNRVSETGAGVTKTYDHDAKGTLRGATVGATAIRYVVDGEARRLARVENGTTTHDWLYRDGLQVAAELDGGGALRWRFVYAAGKHVPDGAIDAAGVAYRIVTDQVGSLRLVVRASDGVVVQRMRHDAWGRVEEDFVAAGATRVPFGFAGGIYDRGTGLVHFGAREYDPRVGRWVEKDPIGFEGGTTGLYGYVSGDPVDLLDDTGESQRCLNWIAVGRDYDPACLRAVLAEEDRCRDIAHLTTCDKDGEDTAETARENKVCRARAERQRNKCVVTKWICASGKADKPTAVP